MYLDCCWVLVIKKSDIQNGFHSMVTGYSGRYSHVLDFFNLEKKGEQNKPNRIK